MKTKLEHNLLQLARQYEEGGQNYLAAETYHNIGREETIAGNIKAAQAFYQKAIQLDSTYAKSYHNLGFIEAQQQQWDSAIAYYQQDIQHQPDYPKAFYNLGLAYEQSNQPDQATACYSHAVKLDSTNLEVYQALAQI